MLSAKWSFIVLKSYSDIVNSLDSNVHVAHVGPTWVLSAPGGPHVGHMNIAIRVDYLSTTKLNLNDFDKNYQRQNKAKYKKH